MFTIKCELYYRQATTIIYLFVISVSMLAFILRIFEIPYDLKSDVHSVSMKDYGTAIWLTVITFTTVGYGDFYPHTLFG
jgi:voltage-gated potassium channel